MSDNSSIEWTDATWNPVTGCTKVSPGCDHCYAERLAERFNGKGSFERVVLHPDRLALPLRWRRPRIVFVNSMSDLFHEEVPYTFVVSVFATMAIASNHTFQILTKRPGRMASVLRRGDFERDVYSAVFELVAGAPALRNRAMQGMFNRATFPLKNVWLGTSVEDQRWADIRIPRLLDTPAEVRFLSCEPLLDAVDLTPHLDVALDDSISWVIVGGESGPRARPMAAAWATSLRDQCVNRGVAFFFKQWGGRTAKAGGRELGGRTWDEMPRPIKLPSPANA